MNYEEHVTVEEVAAGLTDGSIFCGLFEMESNASHVGHIICSGRQIDIIGTLAINRAMHKDMVYVKCEKDGSIGQIVGVAERRVTKLRGMLADWTDETKPVLGQYLFKADDNRYPLMTVQLEQSKAEALKQMALAVIFVDWEKKAYLPKVELFDVFGDATLAETAVKCILFDHRFGRIGFNDLAADELPHRFQKIPDQFKTKSVDFTNTCTVAIDRSTCQCRDDSLSAEIIEGSDNIRIGIHVSDPAYLVAPSSNVYEAAKHCGSSLYLKEHDMVVTMLPEHLAYNLLSLNKDCERSAVSLVSDVTPQGEWIEPTFMKTIVKVRAELSHTAADDLLTDESTDNEIAVVLRCLQTQAMHLYRKRNLVSQFMFLMNTTAATTLISRCPDCALQRRVPQTPDFGDLIDAATLRGVRIDASSVDTVFESLQHVFKPDEPHLRQTLQFIADECMSAAASETFCGTDAGDTTHTRVGAALSHITCPVRSSCVWTSNHIKHRNQKILKAVRGSFAKQEAGTEVFDGYIATITDAGVTVIVSQLEISGRLNLLMRDPRLIAYDEKTRTLTVGNIELKRMTLVKVRFSQIATTSDEDLLFDLIEPAITTSVSFDEASQSTAVVNFEPLPNDSQPEAAEASAACVINMSHTSASDVSPVRPSVTISSTGSPPPATETVSTGSEVESAIVVSSSRDNEDGEPAQKKRK